MEIAFIALMVFLERNRPDLRLRRAWARLRLPRPAVPLRVPVPVALAGADLRRWAVRVTSLLVAYIAWLILSPALPDDPYEGVNNLIGFNLAVVGLGVLGIVASTSGRDRGQDLLAALPAGPRSRVLGWAALLGALAIVEYGLLLAVRYGGPSPAYEQLLPGPWELAQGPLMLLGGGLLGLLLARLVPGWVAAPVGVVLGFFWVGLLSSHGGITMLAPMVEWIQYREDDQILFEPGSFAWHNGYLAGLCALALIAALLREPGRRTALLVTGTAVLAGTATAGLLALP